MNKLRFFIALFSITLITGVAMAQKVDFQLPKLPRNLCRR